jgi:hypothetical protein
MESENINMRRLRRAASLIALGAALFGFGVYRDSKFNNPLDISVDLSRAGQYRQPFRQTASHVYEQAFVLALSPQLTDETEAEQAIGALDGMIQILRPDGSVQWEATLNRDHIIPWGMNGAYYRPTITFRPVPEGDYDLLLTITRPSAQFASRSQRLVCMYFMCEMDNVAGPLALAGGFLSALCGTVLLLHAAVKRLWNRPPSTKRWE